MLLLIRSSANLNLLDKLGAVNLTFVFILSNFLSGDDPILRILTTSSTCVNFDISVMLSVSFDPDAHNILNSCYRLYNLDYLNTLN
jgi:hypothetical protein